MATTARLDIRTITPVVGAVIEGVDLAEPLDPEIVQQIRETVLQQGVVFFPEQELTQPQAVAFLKQFGRPATDPFSNAALADVPEEYSVHDMPTYGNSKATAIWHIDSTLAAEPAALLMLRALELPPGGGGDTCFGSMYAAYEALAEPVREMIDGLYAEHSGYKTLPLLGEGHAEHLQREMRNVHPVVRVHPETGRKALFVNELWTEKIVGVSQHESDCLLRMLWDHSQKPEFTMRWQWRVNDLAFWDNRAFQHYAVRDYEGRRVLQKGYVKGDRPVGPR
ncbi:MAG: TauD/TfdA family dioxygenase [Novosphingobium sp.]|nr:TauD/TfdA family dioxygenase [Novosphingobium sp.]MCP5404126.1 TauD/TfdA family dioxygenase [Novosphingobium sp.]